MKESGEDDQDRFIGFSLVTDMEQERKVIEETFGNGEEKPKKKPSKAEQRSPQAQMPPTLSLHLVSLTLKPGVLYLMDDAPVSPTAQPDSTLFLKI